eukprot:CAMPEP_0184069374 /NCGR_PEP_ID=MMETSP0957-20130417/41608_1 /TAXON_ID=627963 /ORGANISM="Aplanochytrium sp, Strain PBS07" /LENGTH=40 /DNA_ID= /DNA_START= /DNA_END= /DNA_ORIENTATION=
MIQLVEYSPFLQWTAGDLVSEAVIQLKVRATIISHCDMSK